jgi:hypothetical protein
MSIEVIKKALGDAQKVLWHNLPNSRNLPDETAVLTIRTVLSAPTVKKALARANDTVFAFALRRVLHIASDQASDPRDIIARLWDVLDEPELNELLGQNSQIKIGQKKPPAR